jgi:hypothetical protein
MPSTAGCAYHPATHPSFKSTLCTSSILIELRLMSRIRVLGSSGGRPSWDETVRHEVLSVEMGKSSAKG